MLGTVITPIDRLLRWDPVEEAKEQLRDLAAQSGKEYNEGHVEELAKRLDEKFRTQKVESLKELNETFVGMTWAEFIDKVDNSLIEFIKVWEKPSEENCEILFLEKERSVLLYAEGILIDKTMQLVRATMSGVITTNERPDLFLVDLKSCLRRSDKLYELEEGVFRILLDMTDALTYRVLVLDLLPGKKWVSRKVPVDSWLLSKTDHAETDRDYAVLMKLLRTKVDSFPKEVKDIFTDEN